MNKFCKSVLLISIGTFLLTACISQTDSEKINRAQAYKAIALSQVPKSTLDFSKDKSLMPYAEYLVSSGILKEKPSKKTLEGFLTFRDLKNLSSKIQQDIELEQWLESKHPSLQVDVEDFYKFYDMWCRTMNTKGYVVEVEDIIYGIENTKITTNSNADHGTQTKVYLYNNGICYCPSVDFVQGLLDKQLKIVMAGDEIIYIKEVLTKDICYENVLISVPEKDKFIYNIKTVSREFLLADNINIEDIEEGSIVDIHIQDERVDEIVLKGRKIQGQVLAVGEGYVEIGGVGMVYVADNFTVYAQDGTATNALSDIRLGESVYDFYLDVGKLQAVIQTGMYEEKKIRVMIMNNHYNLAYHYTISLDCEADMVIKNGKEEKQIKAGESFTLANSDEWLSNTGRIHIESKDASKPIRVTSIERGQGIPSYTGKLEIIKRDDVLYLINELDIETYVKNVVSSEVPHTFHAEALKAQAICARTYAYGHILANSKLQKYGANVDDSVSYQVYNNYARTQSTDEAVDATKGMVMKYQGKLINALFYSTSSGIGTDVSIWGDNASAYPYLKSHTLTKNKRNIRFTNEAEFERFINSSQDDAYEKKYPLYRWTVNTNSRILSNRIPEVGKVESIVVTERGAGGIAQSIKVKGSTGTITIQGQNEIRYRLGSEDIDLYMMDGRVKKNYGTLPSAYFVVYATSEDEDTKFTIKGGGYGHGVGLSQNAAQEMALSGMNYRQILEYFYDGIEIK